MLFVHSSSKWIANRWLAVPSDRSFWTAAWALALAWSWLLPNHYPPWGTFHAEAWATVVILIGSLAALRRCSGVVAPAVPSLVLMVAALTVWVQWMLGQFAFSGQAWMPFGLFALAALSVLTGQIWESRQPFTLPDAIAFSVGLASIVSVGMQLDQWLQRGQLIIWGMGGGEVRPYANLGQPNLLATLLVWGLLVVLWGVQRQKVRPSVAVLAAAYLLFGVALTQSRTGWLELAALLGGVWLWRRLWRFPGLAWVATILGLYFVLLVLALSGLSATFGVSPPTQLDERLAMASDLRLRAWKLLLDASFAKPWLGYGWGNVTDAQLHVALLHDPLNSKFGHAHNLPLDLVLGAGWPIGMLMMAILGVWYWRRVRAVDNALDATLAITIAIVGLHSMLELPLHHAHFLLPLCLVAGVLAARQVTSSGGFAIRLSWLRAALLASLVGMATLISDYSRIESSYERLRFEWAGLSRKPIGGPPEVYMLNQFHEYIKFLRFLPRPGLSESDLEWMRSVAGAFPSPLSYARLSTALWMNGRPEEAQLRLREICAISDVQQCEDVKLALAAVQKASPKSAKP